jgi:hypothetical protein
MFLYETEKLKKSLDDSELHLKELNEELNEKMKSSEGSINKKNELKEKIEELTKKIEISKNFASACAFSMLGFNLPLLNSSSVIPACSQSLISPISKTSCLWSCKNASSP